MVIHPVSFGYKVGTVHVQLSPVAEILQGTVLRLIGWTMHGLPEVAALPVQAGSCVVRLPGMYIDIN